MGGMNGVETHSTISELHATARESVSPFHDYRTRFRTAELASRLASTLFSRGMCDMENSSERANFLQVQCRE